MLVLEKQKDIQILKAIGSDEQRIQRIFLGEGFLLASIGGIVGTALALLICWLQVHYHLVALQGGTFVIEYYPVKVSFTDICIVLGTVVLVAFAASWFPARRASVQPIALRS
jgi:lipoprotein-releasing system permease protein